MIQKLLTIFQTFSDFCCKTTIMSFFFYCFVFCKTFVYLTVRPPFLRSMCLCVCVRACVRARARACMCVSYYIFTVCLALIMKSYGRISIYFNVLFIYLFIYLFVLLLLFFFLFVCLFVFFFLFFFCGFFAVSYFFNRPILYW